MARDETVRARLVGTAELLALCGAAIAHPLLDLFGRAPDVFLRANASRADLWWFALGVAFVPVFVIVVIESLVAIASERAAALVHRLFVALLAGTLALPLLREHLGARGTILLAVTIAFAGATVAAHSRWPMIRLWFRFASPLPALAVAMFVFASPVSDLAIASGPKPAVSVDVVSTASERPIVMLVLDELPLSVLLDSHGEIDAERFPGFAELARDSVWFRNATTVATHTEQAVPAILTGRYPEAGVHPPLWIEHPDNLFRLLAGSYAMNVDELATLLCPTAHCPEVPASTTPTTTIDADSTVDPAPAPAPILDRGRGGLGSLFTLAREQFGDRMALVPTNRIPEAEIAEEVAAIGVTAPSTSTTRPIHPAEVVGTTVPTERATEPFPGFRAITNEQPVRFVEFLDGIRADAPTRSFHFLHLLLPHVPWHLTADGHPYLYSSDASLQFPGFDGVWTSQVAADAARVRLASQAGFADSTVRSLIEHLRTVGLWDDAIVVVVADHGISLRPGSRTRGIEAGVHDLIGVPLFVHVPDSGSRADKPRIDDRPAQTVDIVPTIADLLDVRLPWPVDGISLLGDQIVTKRSAPTQPLALGEIGGATTLTQVRVADHLSWLLEAGRDVAGTAGPNGERDQLFGRLGPNPDLLGAAATGIADLEPVEVDLDFPDRAAFDRVDLVGELPLHVVGHIEGAEPGSSVVIIVNERVAGVAETFADSQHPARFTALLDSGAFHPGSNLVRFAVLR